MARPQDRHTRRRPFANWMKRLANLKNSSSDPNSSGTSKHNDISTTTKSKVKKAMIKNNPYPASGGPAINNSIPTTTGNENVSFYSQPSGRSLSYESPSESKQSLQVSSEDQQPPTISNNSAAPTMSTNRDATLSDKAPSKAGTVGTGTGALSSNDIGGDEESTFSSPAPSVRSLTTTLTTLQSAAPSTLMPGNLAGTHHGLNSIPASHNNQSSHFTHQFPTSPVASAIPSHVVAQHSGGHPATYNIATANNLLTDNASILTLASSSKRRRRNSLDTNASIRALAPSSIFGGSRESLPMSVLGSSIGDGPTGAGVHHGRPGVAGLASAERASVYSSSGIAPALSSERNSYYAAKQNNPGDGGSVRSGLVSHGRNDSITGSIGGMAAAGSPLASPKEASMQGRVSRRNSEWGEVDEEDSDADADEDKDKTKESQAEESR
ncbi:MAG: hypothetical protein MMC33_008278 [Icmadophila ericetorum]|nr:hypothetical protein [Icmadophila ericetorum]